MIATAMVIALGFAQAAPATTEAGLTLDLWQLDGPLPTWPTVIEGQTPNLSRIVSSVSSIRDPLTGPDGEHHDHFAGVLRGWLVVDHDGGHNLRLVGDDGARLFIDGTQVLDTEEKPGFVDEGGIELAVGLHPIRIEFYEDAGKFALSLEWVPPGEVAYRAIPTTSLRTDAGQSFVVSPGPKRHDTRGGRRDAGDGRPLVEVHPAYTLERFRPESFLPSVGALCAMRDGRIAVATWDPQGAIWIIDPNDADPAAHLFAQGLGEPLGIIECDRGFIVTQKGELTRVTDEDGDSRADRFEAVAQAWPHSANYHEFSFNLESWRGRLWFATSVPLRGGLTDYLPGSEGDFPVCDGPGSIWSVEPATGELRREARGLRTPNGMGRGVDGELFVCDNQGSWLPSSRMNRVISGAFYGHQERRTGNEPAVPPVVWFPHGEIGNSPSQCVLIDDGPHRGQMLVGDVTYGGIQRTAVAQVEGVYQGTVFMHSQGLEAGVNRLAWGSRGDRSLYAGGIGSNGNWNHKGHTAGLERLVPAWSIESGPDAARAAAFEVIRVDAQPHGVLVTLSSRVDPVQLAQALHYRALAWRYEPSEKYGGPKIGLHSVAVTRVEASPAGDQVRLTLDPWREGEVLSLQLHDLLDAYGRTPWSTQSWTTVNRIPSEELPFSAFIGSPKRPVGATAPLDGEGRDAAWEIINGELITPDADAIGTRDLVAGQSHGDCFVHVEWFSPPGGDIRDGQKNGNGGVKLQSRYEVQIMNTPRAPHRCAFNEAGAIYRQRAPDCNASTGAGTWQSYDIWFTAPRWNGERKTANARMTVLWNGILVHNDVEVVDKTGASPPEAPGDHPLLIQAHPNAAEGPVKLRNLWMAQAGAIPPRP